MSDPADSFSELIAGRDSSGGSPASESVTPGSAVSPQPENQTSAPKKPNYCSRCGAAWQPAWTQCLACLDRGMTLVAAGDKRPDSSSIAIALGLYFVLLATSGIGLLIGPDWGSGPSLMIGMEITDCVIITLAAVIFWRKIIDGLVKPFAPYWLIAAPLTACGTFLFASLVMAVEHRLMGLKDISLSGDFFQNGYSWLVVIIAVCVQPALFEETAFRGIVLGSLQPVLSVRDAVIVSALLFMTLHLEIMGIPYLFVMGLVLGYFRMKSGSLIPGMILHFTHNLLCVIAEQHNWGV